MVSNEAPLFNSDKGPNAIREWLLKEDLIDAVIALPPSMFYGTGIPTYVWVLDTNKDPEREGKIQLIDGSGQWDSLRRPMGDKRRKMRTITAPDCSRRIRRSSTPILRSLA